MNFKEPENRNYAGVVVTVRQLEPLAGRDRIVGLPTLGYYGIVGKETEIGQVGVLFPPEVQLSEEFCSNNNLFRHPEKNKDTTKQGYLEENRRVRAIKFAGHQSNCLFMPLESLAYTGVDISQLQDGDVFDSLENHKICEKYYLRQRGAPGISSIKFKPKFVRVEPRLFPEHVDTDNYWREVDKFDPEAFVIVSQKVHGTSIRIGNIPVKRKLSFLERLVKKLRIKIEEQEYAYIYGSRKVIKDSENPDQQHYYKDGEFNGDLWTLEGAKLKGLLPENCLIFAELIGWTPSGAAIQEHYTYQQPEKTAKLIVYRVAFINSQGYLIDLGFDQMREFTRQLGLDSVREMWRGKLKDLKVEQFMDTNYRKLGYNTIPLADDSPVDEGVVVRIEGLRPAFLKAKSPIFLGVETAQLDAGIEDLESVA